MSSTAVQSSRTQHFRTRSSSRDWSRRPPHLRIFASPSVRRPHGELHSPLSSSFLRRTCSSFADPAPVSISSGRGRLQFIPSLLASVGLLVVPSIDQRRLHGSLLAHCRPPQQQASNISGQFDWFAQCRPLFCLYRVKFELYRLNLS